MLISPISVPIIPQAGPISAHFSQTEITLLCRSSRHIRSVSRIARTSSGSVPSTTSKIPFFRNSSSRPLAASSSASSPSFRPTFARSMIDLMISEGSYFFSLNISIKDFRPFKKAGSLKHASVDPIEPPIVIATDGISMKFRNASMLPPLFIIPNTTIASPKRIPPNDAISIQCTFQFYKLRIRSKRKIDLMTLLYNSTKLLFSCLLPFW